jgi:hypothetical protein
VIKPRTVRWTGHVACTEEMRNAYIDLIGKLKGRDYLGCLSVDGKMILKWNFK